MNSPITGKPMIKGEQSISMSIKGIEVTVLLEHYMCVDSGALFSDPDMAQRNVDKINAEVKKQRALTYQNARR